MIKIDASNLIPKRLGTYLLGVIPGCFFELALAFGDPTSAHKYIDLVHQVYSVNGYVLVSLFLISCLAVGETFYFASWFLDILFDSGYRFLRYTIFHLTLGSDWLYKAVGKWQGVPPKRSARLLWKPIQWARGQRFSFRVRPVIVCQRIITLQLLRAKYGTSSRKGESSAIDEEWQVWTAALGKAPASLKESFLLMRVTIACGLAELSALYVCPELRNRYFAVMCSVLLLAGIIQLYFAAKSRSEPIRSNMARLFFLLEELEQHRLLQEKHKIASQLSLDSTRNNDDSEVAE